MVTASDTNKNKQRLVQSWPSLTSLGSFFGFFFREIELNVPWQALAIGTVWTDLHRLVGRLPLRLLPFFSFDHQSDACNC